jgi:hypothetical protein
VPFRVMVGIGWDGGRLYGGGGQCYQTHRRWK